MCTQLMEHQSLHKNNYQDYFIDKLLINIIDKYYIT